MIMYGLVDPVQHKQKYIPKQVVWELTLKCNLKCIHCGSSAGKPRPNELSLRESLKLCRDLAEINANEVCFMGGEPFLQKEWYKLGKEVKDLGMKLLLISNGYMVNSDIISKLVKLQPYGVSTSLDGATAETHDHIRGVHGSFKKVMEFISLSRKVDLPTTVITTVNKLNFKELPKIKDFLLDKNIYCITSKKIQTKRTACYRCTLFWIPFSTYSMLRTLCSVDGLSGRYIDIKHKERWRCNRLSCNT